MFRRAARLIVLDREGAVLLFEYQDARFRFWGTPGGGLEPGESFAAAAIREAHEELALPPEAARALLSPAPLWQNTVEFTNQARPLRQEEHYFLMRVARAELPLGPAVQAAHLQEGIIAVRWWSLAELRGASEVIFPVDLVARLTLLDPALG
jgi:8-oxo-dGTP pyrophosphatase MutT (NUDIX family)